MGTSGKPLNPPPPFGSYEERKLKTEKLKGCCILSGHPQLSCLKIFVLYPHYTCACPPSDMAEQQLAGRLPEILKKRSSSHRSLQPQLQGLCHFNASDPTWNLSHWLLQLQGLLWDRCKEGATLKHFHTDTLLPLRPHNICEVASSPLHIAETEAQ